MQRAGRVEGSMGSQGEAFGAYRSLTECMQVSTEALPLSNPPSDHPPLPPALPLVRDLPSVLPQVAVIRARQDELRVLHRLDGPGRIVPPPQLHRPASRFASVLRGERSK